MFILTLFKCFVEENCLNNNYNKLFLDRYTEDIVALLLQHVRKKL